MALCSALPRPQTRKANTVSTLACTVGRVTLAHRRHFVLSSGTVSLRISRFHSPHPSRSATQYFHRPESNLVPTLNRPLHGAFTTMRRKSERGSRAQHLQVL